MKKSTKFSPGLILVVALWLALTGWAWLKPDSDSSLSERRPLAQFPQVSANAILSGDFMEEFADWAVDQFPLRDTFRQLKAITSQYLLGQTDNNSIYITDGSAVKMEYPLSAESLSHAIDRFNDLYQMYLADAETIVFAVVPDKSYYLGESSGHLTMDYEALFSTMAAGLPWADYVNLADVLNADSYYRTDTHWRQESILPVAEKLLTTLGAAPLTDTTVETLDMDFYGVYFGQAALPMAPDALSYVTWEGWEDCTVYHHDNGTTSGIYDFDKVAGKDPYDLFLSGGMAVQTISNPHAESQRHLVVFRDSFGSSLVPLLVRDYATVTLVDTRYIFPDQVGNYVNFEGADVLMLYSTSVLNSSSILRK